MTRIAENNISSIAAISHSGRSRATAQSHSGTFAAFFAVRGIRCVKPTLKVKNCFH